MSDSVAHETLCSTRVEAQIEQRRAGLRDRVFHGGRLCSRCLKAPPASAKVRYCADCHAAYERDRRLMLKEKNERNAAIAAGVVALLDNQNNLSKGKDNGQYQRDGSAPPLPATSG